jgi:hypothetical protein
MTRPHQYVQCDVPEGMTLAEYRSAKSAAVRKQRRRGLVARLRGKPVGAEPVRRAA